MASPKRGLGRGLEALIPTGPPAAEVVDINSIVPNPRQPRGQMDAQALQELADSIRQHGLLQPLLVAEAAADDDGQPVYQIIAGERRWQAAKLAGLERLPVVVKEATPSQMLQLALVENLQRADLSPLETATAYRQLVDEFQLSQEEVASKVGKSRSAVANSLRLLSLEPEIKSSLANLQITEGHARALLGLPLPPQRLRAWRYVLQRGLNVRQTEALVRREQQPASAPRPRRLDADTDRLEEELRQALGTRVTLVRGQRGGRLVIHFYSEEELSAIYERLVGSG